MSEAVSLAHVHGSPVYVGVREDGRVVSADDTAGARVFAAPAEGIPRS